MRKILSTYIYSAVHIKIQILHTDVHYIYCNYVYYYAFFDIWLLYYMMTIMIFITINTPNRRVLHQKLIKLISTVSFRFKYSTHNFSCTSTTLQLLEESSFTNFFHSSRHITIETTFKSNAFFLKWNCHFAMVHLSQVLTTKESSI